MVLCEWNPPVAGEFPLQRASDVHVMTPLFSVFPEVDCPARVDLAIVLDQSSSITFQGTDVNWHLMLNFVKELVGSFPIGQSLTRVAVVTFSNHANIQWTFNAFGDLVTLEGAIDDLEHMGGNTSISAGLRVTREQLYGDPNSGNRPEVVDVTFVITDGRANVLADTVSITMTS